MFKLYINDKLIGETICPMPCWEMERHPEAKDAYVTDENGRIVNIWNANEKCFSAVKE